MARGAKRALSCSLFILITAQSAGAAEVRINRVDRVHFTAASGEANQLTVSLSGSPGNWKVTVNDDGAPITVGHGCESVGVAAVCTFPTVSPGHFKAELGNGDDRATGTRLRDAIDGQLGSDVIRGRGGDDLFIGGYGRQDLDQVWGGTGNDSFNDASRGSELLFGGAGNDRFRADSISGFDADSAFAGGAGRDSAFYTCGRCRVSLDGRANDGRPNYDSGDNVDAESVSTNSDAPGTGWYGSGLDVLRGSDKAEILRAKRGNDKIIGGKGSDVLDGGLDPDRIVADDGTRDVIDCGEGDDVVRADPVDEVARNCERVRVQ